MQLKVEMFKEKAEKDYFSNKHLTYHYYIQKGRCPTGMYDLSVRVSVNQQLVSTLLLVTSHVYAFVLPPTLIQEIHRAWREHKTQRGFHEEKKKCSPTPSR